MGYLFLCIALLAGAAKGYCGKRTSGYTGNFRDAILANTIRMLLCSAIGFVLIVATEDLKCLLPNPRLLLTAAFSGISTAIFVVTWLICVRKSAYMMLDIFLMLGILIPLITSNVFFQENIEPNQWLGIAVLFVAVIIMCAYNNSIKTKLTPSALILLLVCGAANGFADLSQKLFIKTVPDGSVAVFNFYTYIIAFLILTAAFAVTHKTEKKTNKADIKKIFGYIFVMAVCLFANSFFKTLAAKYLNAVLLYPLSQGCALVLSTIMSAVLFKEKLTKKAVFGIITAFVGLLIINLL